MKSLLRVLGSDPGRVWKEVYERRAENCSEMACRREASGSPPTVVGKSWRNGVEKASMLPSRRMKMLGVTSLGIELILSRHFKSLATRQTRVGLELACALSALEPWKSWKSTV